MTRSIALAVDDSEHSRHAVDWTMRHLFRRYHDTLHLICVVPDAPATGAAATHVGSGAALAHHSGKAQLQERANETLKKTANTVVDWYKVPKDTVHMHVLPGTGGASGVAESINAFVTRRNYDVLIVGSRGMAVVERVCMSFIGLGSVSEYCVHNAVIPVLVVRFAEGREPILCAEANPPSMTQEPKKVYVSTDGSGASYSALTWALDNLLSPHDQLHLLLVSCPAPLLDEEDKLEAQQACTAVIEAAAEAANQHGVLRNKISSQVLDPHGTGSSDVGAAICKVVHEKEADIIVVGCRGLGAVSRSIMGMLGLGSVSDYLVHNGPCPLLVVKSLSPESMRSLAPPLGCEGSLMQRVDEEEGVEKEGAEQS